MRRSIEGLHADCEASLSSVGVGAIDALRGGSILVTGASGFVGSWLSILITYLNDHHGFGIRITGVSRHRSRLLGQAGAFLDGRQDFTFIGSDVRQMVGSPSDVDWIIHAAGSPDNRRHATDPVETMSIIGEGTARALKLAEQAVALRGFLHFSSGLVNGSAGGMLGETDFAGFDPLSTGHVYAEAKRYSESLCAAFRTQSRVPVVVTRPFTFVGPFQPLDAPWAVNNFLHAAVNGQPLKVLGDGESRRTFLYGSDMAVLALLQLTSGEVGEAYNLGGATPLSLRDLAKVVVEASGGMLEVRYNTGRGNLVSSDFIPDMKRSDERFGFVPAFQPRDAVRRTLEWSGVTKPPRIHKTISSL